MTEMGFMEIQTEKLLKERLKIIQTITTKTILALYKTTINLLKFLLMSIATLLTTTVFRTPIETMADGEAILARP
jgi:hypothetical protein